MSHVRRGIVKLYSMVSKANDAAQEEKRKAEFRAAQNAKVAALKRIEASKLGKVPLFTATDASRAQVVKQDAYEAYGSPFSLAQPVPPCRGVV